MGANRQPLIDRSRGKPSRNRRRLRFEPLESRTVLSAVAATAPALCDGLPAAGWLPERAETAAVADFGDRAGWLVKAARLAAPTVGRPGKFDCGACRGSTARVVAPAK